MRIVSVQRIVGLFHRLELSSDDIDKVFELKDIAIVRA